jgi:hypothetical protein
MTKAPSKAKPAKQRGRRVRDIIIGDKVKHYGTVRAVVFTGGERYLMCHKNGCVSLMPATACELLPAEGRRK